MLPGERMKNTGMAGPLSLYDSAKGIALFSVYFLPNRSSINMLQTKEISALRDQLWCNQNTRH